MQQRNNSTSSPSTSEPKRSAANSATTTITEIKLSHVAIVICLVVAAAVSSFSIVVNIRRYFIPTANPNPTQTHNHQVERNQSWKKIPHNPNNSHSSI